MEKELREQIAALCDKCSDINRKSKAIKTSQKPVSRELNLGLDCLMNAWAHFGKAMNNC